MSDLYTSIDYLLVIENLQSKFNHLGNISQSWDKTEITIQKINQMKNLIFKLFLILKIFIILFNYLSPVTRSKKKLLNFKRTVFSLVEVCDLSKCITNKQKQPVNSMIT